MFVLVREVRGRILFLSFLLSSYFYNRFFPFPAAIEFVKKHPEAGAAGGERYNASICGFFDGAADGVF